ncbi:PE family protein [Amycolatopsis marina]|uniref:PE family protein n=1 Tax=Amycolatopsis marina TaxID=490629 RepID=A0A1I1ACN8_9PSEU|nr:PE domain-containing protein [Amycolatopsis marina]SFB34240.1 PE family protein [Amycolatopsis marina]
MAEREVTPAQGFAADPDRLLVVAGDFDGLAARAAAIATELGGVLAGATVPPWGDDEVGRGFAASHEQRAIRALDRIEGLAGELAAMGARFSSAAAAYRDADEAAVADVAGTEAGD